MRSYSARPRMKSRTSETSRAVAGRMSRAMLNYGVALGSRLSALGSRLRARGSRNHADVFHLAAGWHVARQRHAVADVALRHDVERLVRNRRGCRGRGAIHCRLELTRERDGVVLG